MYKLSGFFLAAAAVLCFSGAARAGESALLALNLPAKPAVNQVTQALKEPATAQARLAPAGYTDFDAFSSVNDPLYREGAREMLKQVIKEDKAPAPARQELRDAPISKDAKPGKPLKRAKLKKPVHADPIKGKSTL